MKYILISLLLFTGAFSQSYLDSYTSYSEMKSELKKLKVKTSKIGKSFGGKDIVVAQFGKPNQPAIFVVGNIDGDYYVGTELAMKLIRDLSSGKVKRNGKTIYVLPMPNPDAVIEGMKSPQSAQIFNSRKVDNDHDLLFGEDKINDLNKDGIISQLRIKRPNGMYSSHEKYAELLTKVDPLKEEAGTYILLQEGKDDDNDNKTDEDGFGGVNINQNFTYNYGYFENGAGENQISEPETKAIADFIFDRPNILITVSFSKFDNILNPWKANSKLVKDMKRPLRAFSKMTKEDKDPYKFFSESWKNLHEDWKTSSKNKGKGTFHEWSYFHAGRWSISLNGWNKKQIELDTTFVKQEKMTVSEKLFHYANVHKLKKAIIPWKKITHPDYQTDHVEVGGLHSSYLNNPAKEVFSTTKSSKFIERLTNSFPKLKLVSSTTKSLGKNLYRTIGDYIR